MSPVYQKGRVVSKEAKSIFRILTLWPMIRSSYRDVDSLSGIFRVHRGVPRGGSVVRVLKRGDFCFVLQRQAYVV